MGNKSIEIDISDVLIERPIGFTFRHRHYCLYPLTLGTTQLMTRFLHNSGLEKFDTENDLFAQILFAASYQREACLRALAYMTLKGEECLNEKIVKKRCRRFRKIPTTDLAALLVTILASDKTKIISDFYGIDKENQRLVKVAKIKEKSNRGTVTFGAKSIWGTLIDTACQRYGWTYQYVIWGISLTNLQLLLLDQEKSVYLDDKERKQVRGLIQSQTIKAENTAAFNDFVNKQSWR